MNNSKARQYFYHQTAHHREDDIITAVTDDDDDAIHFAVLSSAITNTPCTRINSHDPCMNQVYTTMVPTNEHRYTKTSFIHTMNSYMFWPTMCPPSGL
jgi:hypothetical protein